MKGVMYNNLMRMVNLNKKVYELMLRGSTVRLNNSTFTKIPYSEQYEPRDFTYKMKTPKSNKK